MSFQKRDLEKLRIDWDAVPQRSNASRILLVLGLGLGLIAGAGWWFLSAAVPEVETVIAKTTSASADRTVLNASGYVTARRQATVSSKVTGKVVEVLIEEGMQVKADQVLARLDSANLDTNLRLAESQLAATRSAMAETEVNLRQAKIDLQRVQSLAEEEIASDADLDQAKAKVDSLQARLKRQQQEAVVAERQVAVWKQQLEDTIIRAPFAGVVIGKNAQPGEMISPISAGGGFTRTGICTIVDMESLEVEVDVNESYINRVSPAQPVEATLNAYPAAPFQGKVIAIVPTADRQKATVRVRISFEELDPRILPEMGVKVAFQQPASEEEKGLEGVRLPESALSAQEDAHVVFVLKDNRLVRRKVSVRKTYEDEFLVEGIEDGEKVVIGSSVALKDQMAVEEAR